jgi:predicted 3-demethylubiquinone-9 3-methyltransferase (glyoxalase superfamily)
MQKITPFLWFKDNAEEAANFYVSVFKNSKILNVMRYGDAGPGPKGGVMLVNFELDGGAFTALNGNTSFRLATLCRWLCVAKVRMKSIITGRR